MWLEKIAKPHLDRGQKVSFLTYDISGDPGLRKLFTKAGCASILDYAHELNKNDGQLKSPEFIYRYLSKSGEGG